MIHISKIIIAFFLISISLNSQNKGLVAGRIESTVTVIGSDDLFPHYYTDMPIDCIIGYILMDSVTRHQDTKHILMQVNNWDIITLKKWVKYLYDVTNYDPLLLRSYIQRTIVVVASQDLTYGDHYSYPSNLYYGIENAIKNKIDEFSSEFDIDRMVTRE